MQRTLLYRYDPDTHRATRIVYHGPWWAHALYLLGQGFTTLGMRCRLHALRRMRVQEW